MLAKGRGSLKDVEPLLLTPTPDMLGQARDIVAAHLAPTPTVALAVRGRTVWAKLENLQVTGSFKVRGALVALSAVAREDAGGAVVTASAGNHGLGVAHASGLTGVRATVVVPENASTAKVAKLRSYPIELVQHGQNYDEAQAYAKELADRRSLHFVSAFNNPWVVAGQATVFDEMLTQAPDLDQVVVPVGGGGLMAGTVLSAAARGRAVQIDGVQPAVSAALYHVLRGATMAEVVHGPTIADGLAGGGDDGAITNAIIGSAGVALHLVPESAIRAAVREAVEVNGLVMEGSSAAAYAGLAHGIVPVVGQHPGFIVSGRNISFSLLTELLAETPDELSTLGA